MGRSPLTTLVDWQRFQPDDTPIDRAKARTVGVLRPGYRTSTDTWTVPRDDNGKPAGTQTEHWSGRLDAHVKPETVRAKIPRRSTDNG